MCCHWSILSWSRCLIHIIFQWIPFAWQLGCKAHILIFSPATIFFYVDDLLFMLLHEYYQEDLLQFVCGEKKIFQQVSMITLYTPSYLISLFWKRHCFLLYHWTCVVADLSLREQNIVHVNIITGYPSDVGTSLYRAARFMCGEFKLWKGHSAVFVQL